MGTDAIESMGQILREGNNHYISIQADTKEEAQKLYAGLSNGGTIEMELGDALWSAYFGMFMDRYGIQWMVNYDKEG